MNDRSALHRSTVVVVEDEALVREIAVCELEDGGFEVVGFGTADDAMVHLAQHGDLTAVLFTDVQMPGRLNGLDLAAIVAQRWPALQVLVTSGGVLVDQGNLPSRAQFVAKPWRGEDIVRRVRRLAATSVPQADRAAPSSGHAPSAGLLDGRQEPAARAVAPEGPEFGRLDRMNRVA